MSQEITAEYSAEELLAPVELRVQLRTTVAARTDMGRVRDNNEDKFEFYIAEDRPADKGSIFLVCDGMGGHNAGQVASELATKTFIKTYLDHPSTDPEVAARAAVESANRIVYDWGTSMPQYRGMGTTLTALILIQDQYVLAHAGDSRCYRLEAEGVRQLSDEHTWVHEMITSGAMTPEEAERHPYKHMITKAIGNDGLIGPQIDSGTVFSGDLFLLCSDGLTNHVRDAQLAAVLQSEKPGSAVWTLVNHALADGGSDNCTAMVVRVDGLDPLD